jgi:heme A synthase
MHRVTLGICAAAVLIAIACAVMFMQGPISVAWFAGAQVVVFGFLAIYAWVCREHRGASRFLLTAALLCAGVSGVILCRVCAVEEGRNPIVTLWLLLGQVLFASLGGYLGYAAVERRRTQRQEEPAAGKLVVSTILLAAGAVVVGMFFSQL